MKKRNAQPEFIVIDFMEDIEGHWRDTGVPPSTVVSGLLCYLGKLIIERRVTFNVATAPQLLQASIDFFRTGEPPKWLVEGVNLYLKHENEPSTLKVTTRGRIVAKKK